MSSVRRTFTALAVTAALAGGLTGCGTGGDQPKVASRISPSATSSAPTRTPSRDSAPTIPATALLSSKSGAKAYVKYYWSLADHAQATGETNELAAATSPRCKACTAGLRAVRAIYDAGNSIRGGGTTLTNLSASPFSVADRHGYRVTMKIHNSAQLIDYIAPAKDQKYPAATVEADVIVERAASGWIVAFWETT